MDNKNYNFIISINVHEKPNFLKKQINNIKQFVEDDFLIIINPNVKMYSLLKNDYFFLDNNIIITPDKFN